MSISVIAHTFAKLSLFESNQNKVLSYLVSAGMSAADDYTKGAVVKMIGLVTSETSDYEKTTIIRCLEEIALFKNTPVIFIVNEGEDFSFEVDLEEGKNFEGYGLRAYNAQDGSPLGPSVEGTDAAKQDVPVTDLSLSSGHTYRAHVVLESGAPSSVLLTEAFLIVEDTIDYGD